MIFTYLFLLLIPNLILSDLCILHNYEISFKKFTDHRIITIEFEKPNPYNSFRQLDRRIKYLFNKFDTDQNGYLSYVEGKLYQEITHPDYYPMPFNAYKQLCNLIGCKSTIGLNIYDFQNTYFLYKNQLNTDLSHDYEIITKLEKNIIYQFKGGYM